MKKNHLLILLYFCVVILWVEPRKEDVVNLAVLLPIERHVTDHEPVCLRETINLAIQRVNSAPDFISNEKIKYTLKAHFLKAKTRDADFIDALYDIYDNGTKMLGGIGPPYEDKFSLTGDLCTLVFQSLLVAYKEILGDELRIEDFFFSSSPTINSGILAARKILDHFKWEKVGIIYDFASARYRKNVDNLRRVLENQNNENISTRIVSLQGIWSTPPEYPVSEELASVQKEGARIVFALVSVKGARKLFCEAFKRKMMKPKVVWILFETLPRGWATDIKSTPGKKDIDCTENQLLQASRGYISIVQQGIRSDNKTIIGNFSKDSYKKAIEKLTKNKECDENNAYVYDAVWLLANIYRLYLQNTGKTLEIDENPRRGFQFHLKEISKYRRAVSFEGITGPFSFDNTKKVPGVASRIGQISIWTHPSDFEHFHLGSHDTDSNYLWFDKDVNKNLFDRGIVTKDSAVENITYATIMVPMIITIWLITFLGVLMTIILFLFIIAYSNDKTVMTEAPLISCIILTGSLLSYLSIIIYGLDTYYISKEDIPKKCSGFLLLLSISFTLVFGSLFTKAWRIYKLYITPNVKVIQEDDQIISTKNIPDSTLCIIIAGFVIIDLIIFGTWIGKSPFKPIIFDISETQDLFADVITKVKRVECCSDDDTIFKIVMYCFKGVILVFGLFLAIQNQNGKVKVPDDTRQISMCIYNVFVVTLIGVISVILLPNASEYQASYGIVSACIWICTTTTLLLMYFPKITLAIASEKIRREERRKNNMNAMKNARSITDAYINADDSNSPNGNKFNFPIADSPKKPLQEEPLPEFLNQYFTETSENEKDEKENTVNETKLDEHFTSNKDSAEKNVTGTDNEAFENFPEVDLYNDSNEDIPV